MRFRHIDAAFEACRRHKSEAQTAGLDAFRLREVEHYLLRSLILLIVSQYEGYIESLFVKRAERSGDVEIRNLMVEITDRKFRSPDLGKIKEMLTMLSKGCCNTFSSQIEVKQPQVKAAWDSLITARHAIVHGANAGAVGLTWTDLESAYEDSTRVLQALANSLGLSKKDLSQL
jgi:hypothetical protein